MAQRVGATDPRMLSGLGRRGQAVPTGPAAFLDIVIPAHADALLPNYYPRREFSMRFLTASLLPILLIAVSACDRGTDSISTAVPLTIDGSSIAALRSSREKMLKAYEKDGAALAKLERGFEAVFLQAGQAMRLLIDVHSQTGLTAEDFIVLMIEKQQQIQAIILDGLTAVEIMEYGQSFEFSIEPDDLGEDKE